MISALISLLITLTILYVVYVVVKWIAGKFPEAPSVIVSILNIVFAVAALIAVLNFISPILGLK